MEKTNFLARVMGISFVTLLTLLQGMSYLSMTDMEKAFNEIHRQQVMRMVSDSDFRPLNLEYIAVTKKDSLLPDIIYKGRNLLNREVIPWLSAPPLKAGTRHYREISGIKTTVFLNTMERDGSHIEAGFSYTSYRSYVHPASSKLLLLVVGLAFIVLTGFRLFFLNAFVRPLKQLVNGVQQVNEGNLDASVPVRTGDEIGYLAESFNKMVISIRNSSNELDRIHLYLKNIIDSMPSILIGLDSNGRVTHWNMEAEKQTELTENEALGKTLDELASQFTRNIKDLIKITDERSPKKFGKIPITIDGKTRINDVMVYPLIVNGVRGAVIRVDDITDRVRFEEMMVQSEKMASVGGLAAGMAHEINNPLGGIMLAAQNISRRLTADMEKNIEAARRAGTDIKAIRQYMEEREIVTMLQGIFEMGERASKIVSNMLNFSRRSESRMAPTDILDLTEKTLELAANDYNLKKQFDFRHIEIIRDFDKDIPAVSCIVTEIQQVLLNLFKNAAQAMSSKKYVGETPHITLRIKKEPSSVRIEVEDNGPGIDESIRKRVFEPFFTTKNTGTGTGLGLSVSYFIITNDHKGTLSVDSLPGKWTRFIISIPYSKQGKAGISADPPLAEERGPE